MWRLAHVLHCLSTVYELTEIKPAKVNYSSTQTNCTRQASFFAWNFNGKTIKKTKSVSIWNVQLCIFITEAWRNRNCFFSIVLSTYNEIPAIPSHRPCLFHTVQLNDFPICPCKMFIHVLLGHFSDSVNVRLFLLLCYDRQQPQPQSTAKHTPSER